MRRPLVGITAGQGARGRHALREEYVLSVERACALPVVLAPVAPESVCELLARLDGVVLSGGGDLDPALYGRGAHPKLGRVDRRRDLFELALAREALSRDVPLLAICRGLQVLNVATGGTLIQDIPSEWEGAGGHDASGPRWKRAHEVSFEPHSCLRAILGRDTVAVNSFHHQAIDVPGRGLEVSGRSPDGIVEAAEDRTRRFAVGVQWHPESFVGRRDSFQRLFDAHAGACRQ